MAISTDDVPDAANMADLVGAGFLVLSDADHDVASRYGVFNLLGDGASAPATFIVNGEGNVTWKQVGEHISDRADPEEIVRQARWAGRAP